MRPKLKYAFIHLHQNDYPISTMCRIFGVSRSGYYDYLNRSSQIDKDSTIAQMLAEHQIHCKGTYGYRRMHLWLDIQGIHRNPKTILRIMKKYGILSEIRRKRPWRQFGYHKHHRYQNLLARDFHADRPNHKWVTDISYIRTGQGFLYLSIIRDLYDNRIVAHQTSSRPTVTLVLDTIRAAMKDVKEKVAGKLQLHSDQGFQYSSHGYFNLTQEYGIVPSMSRRGNPYDNAMAENFFSILKTECIYRQQIDTLAQADLLIDEYIEFYNRERIQLKLGGAPLEHRFLFP